MLLQKGFVKVLYPLFWNTLIIIRDYVLAKFPFSSIVVFIFFRFTAIFCNLIDKFTDLPFIFDDFAFLISFNFKCLT